MSDRNFETIQYEQFDGYARITINRPKVMNALNEVVLEELHEAVIDRLDPEQTRVVVLRGAGDRAFVAGADIGPMGEMSPDEALEFSRLGQALTLSIEAMPQIFVACVDGFALGGGNELMMACDIIVASGRSKFGQPEVNLGLIPGFGGTQRLARRVGLPLALDMICCGQGRMLGADEALGRGLVSRVVEAADLEKEVDEVVKSLLKAGPAALAEAKRLTRQSLSMRPEEGLASEASGFALCFTREESMEGMKAFIEKRTPRFR